MRRYRESAVSQSSLMRPSSLGFEKMRSYDVTYFGYNGDGHFGRHNLSLSTYFAVGTEENGIFTDEESDIGAFFAAFEYSRDYDWMRARGKFGGQNKIPRVLTPELRSSFENFLSSRPH